MSSKSQFCWIPDEDNVYRIAEIISGYGTDEYKIRVVDGTTAATAKRPSAPVSVKASKTFPIDSMEELSDPPSDLIRLTDVHRPGILHTLRTRFDRDIIYTSIGPILIALNPFRWIPGLYDDDVKMKYHKEALNLSDNPHVFAVAHDSLMGLQFGKNQSLVISGESGAGKTEATKQCLNYLAAVAGSSSGVHDRILLANPILESWGNAKTLRNNNSSRFGKFIEILIARSGEIVGSSNTTYLLEKSRVVFQEKGERSYHIFYQFLFGGPADLIEEFGLVRMRDHPEEVSYINQSGCLRIDGVDDKAEFDEVEKAQNVIGFGEEYKTLLRIVAGILHLGNIHFGENPNDSEESVIVNQSENHLEKAIHLFGVDKSTFPRSLLFKTVRSGSKRKSVSFSPYSPLAASENRNALAKAIYSRCFDFIVERINSSINADPESLASIQTSMIGVLDIFGFEIFQKNSFEQLCINLANEALQRHFNIHIFQTEMEIYMSEDIVIPNLTYNDNQDVLDLLIKKPKGLIPMLDEEGQVPRGSWEGFLNKFTKHHSGTSKRLKFRPGSKVFSLIHYAGEVVYEPSQFISKNKDTLSADLVEAMATSSVPLLANIFSELVDYSNSVGRSSTLSSKQTVGTKFRVQLDSLMTTLNATEPRYIRCIKPNALKKGGIFEAALTNEQLTYSGVFEAVIIMQNGYPFRLSHREFRNRYHMLARHPEQRQRIFGSETDTCGRLELQALGEILSEQSNSLKECHVGRTMVFYRVEQHRELESLRKCVVDSALRILQRNLRGYVARNLYVRVRDAIHICTRAIFKRNVVLMNSSVSTLQEMRERVLTVYSIDLGVQECCSVANGYAEAIESEKVLVQTISAYMDDEADIFQVFDALSEAVAEAKSLHFHATLNGVNISVEWDKNPLFVNADKKVEKYRKIIDIKTNLDRGVLENDEITLNHWLQKLEECRVSGEVDPRFCKEEESMAKATVKTAQEIYSAFLASVNNAILTGRLTYKIPPPSSDVSSFEDMIKIKADVDPSDIKKFLSDFDKMESHNNARLEKDRSSARSSMQMARLLQVCRELCTLREAAFVSDWETVWKSLSIWKNYLQTFSINLHGGAENDVDELQVLPVVVEVESALRDEIRAFFICAIAKVKFESLAVELRRDCIPPIPQLEMPSVDLSELSTLVEFISTTDCVNLMCAQLCHALEFAASKVRLRKAIVSIDKGCLCSILESSETPLPPSDEDMLKGRVWLAFYNCVDDIRHVLRNGGPKGPPGHLDMLGVSIGALQRTLQMCISIKVEPQEKWDGIISAAEALCRVRASLCDGDNVKSSSLISHMMNSSSESRIFSISYDGADGSESDLFMEVLGLVKNEIMLCKRELDHLKAVQDLVDAISQGSVHGEVGALDIQSVQADSLREAVSSCRNSLIYSDEIVQLVQDCELLITLRSCVMSSEWDYLLRLAGDLYETSNGFSSTHHYVKSEFEVIFGEAQDLQARKKMEIALAENALYVGDDDELHMIESVKPWENLRNSILFSKSQKSLSFEAKFLLANSILVFALRECVRKCLWEDEYLLLQGVRTSDIAFKLTENCKIWSDEEVKGVIVKLMATQRRQYLDNIESIFGFDNQSYDELRSDIDVNVNLLLAHAQAIEIHDCAYDEIALIRRVAIERRCRAVIVLAASVDRIEGTVECVDNSRVGIDILLQCLAYVNLYSSQTSELLRLWSDAAMDILNFRIIVGDKATQEVNVDLSSYITTEDLLRCENIVRLADESDEFDKNLRGFPVSELKLVVEHVYDCLSIEALADSLHLGRPQFYNGKFDTQHVEYNHVINALEVAKKCRNRSDRLDRLMFYAELCVMLRKAIISHKWDLSESGQRTHPVDNGRGVGVKQCLFEYEQSLKFFQRKMEGIPPATVTDEFILTQREWERRLILQGYPAALQAGKIGGTNGNLLLHEVKYQRLADQIDLTRSWFEQTQVKDPDLDLLVKAGQEIVNVRKRCLEVHAKYKREVVFRKPTNSIREIVLSDFISEAIFTALEKVEGLLVYPYPMTTEWKLVDQAVSKMEISGRLEATRMQVELLGTETFERNFNGNCIRIFHNLNDSKYSPPHDDDVKHILSELRASCQSFRARASELSLHASIKPSETSEFLYISCVVLIHLLAAESAGKYEHFQRSWLSSGPDNQADTTPSISKLCSNIVTKTYNVQSVLRAVAEMPKIHPCVMNQILRVTKHVEDEITSLELSQALSEGAVTGCVGHVRHDRISSVALASALDRAIMFAVTDEHSESDRCASPATGGVVSRKSSVWKCRNTEAFGRRGSVRYSAFRKSARFRYSSRYTSNQIAYIEMKAGLKEAVATGDVGGVVYNDISDNILKSALTISEVQSAHRPDVVRLRHTCEIVCELRDALAMKNYQKAFDIINDNIGQEGQTFKELLSTIYAADFAIHPLAVEEFSLIALETCESYWRFAAKRALIRGCVTGSRCCFQMSEVNCESIDEVLNMIEGLVDVSRASIIVREVCFMIKHMRKSVINAIVSHELEDEFYQKRKEKIPDIASNKLAAVLKLGFVDDAINNALLVVRALSPLSYRDIIKTNYAKFVTIENIVDHARESVRVIHDDDLVDTHRKILLDECDLISSFCRFYSVMLALERLMNTEAVWFSYSSSRLEMDKIIKGLLSKAVQDAVELRLDADIPAERIWFNILAVAQSLWHVVEVCQTDKDQSSEYCIGTEYFSSMVVPQMVVFCETVSSVEKETDFFLPAAVVAQRAHISNALRDHSNYCYLKELVSDSSFFAVRLSGDDSDQTHRYIEPISVSSYSADHPDLTYKKVHDIEMHSFAGSTIKSLTELHLKMRACIMEEQWADAEVYANSILLEQFIEIEFEEANMVLQYCRTLTARKRIEQGLVNCVFPPVPGWSDFSTASALAFGIVDLPLRAGMDAVTGELSSVGGKATIDFRHPSLVELMELGRCVLSLVCAVRRRTWGAEYIDDDTSGDGLHESTFREDMFTKLFPMDSSSAPVIATERLHEAYREAFRFEERDITVRSALQHLQTALRQCVFLSESVRAYLDFMVNSASVEQRIFELYKIVRDALCQQKVLGIPGYLKCSQDAYDAVSSAVKRLENEKPVLSQSIGLKRAFQSLKLCRAARSAVLKQDWYALGPIMHLYHFMVRVDIAEGDNQCAELMHLPILSDSDLLRQSSKSFDNSVYSSIKTFSEYSVQATQHSSDKKFTSDKKLEEYSQCLLDVSDTRELLQPLTDIDNELRVLEKHFYFEKACHLFAVALERTPAQGDPGELRKDSIEYNRFYQVNELLRDSGLLQYESGQRLLQASSAMIDLRVSQRSGRIEDIKVALQKCKEVMDEEKQTVLQQTASAGVSQSVSRKYISEAAGEIDTASSDFVQLEVVQLLYKAIISDRLPMSNELTAVVALTPQTETLEVEGAASTDITTELSNAIRESIKRGVTSNRGRILLNTARLVMNIRKYVLNRDWADLRALFSEYDMEDKGSYDRIAIDEVECARRLMLVSCAVELAKEAVDTNRIRGLIGEIDISAVSVVALERACEQFDEVKSEWRTKAILPYYVSCTSLMPIRSYAVKEDWSAVYDCATVALEKSKGVFQLTPNAQLEIQLAHDHAGYVISRRVLVDALSNGRMEGDVGEINTACISSTVVEEAINICRKIGIDHPDIERLEAYARIIYDLRCAQQIGCWMSDPSNVEDTPERVLLPDTDTMVTTMSLYPISRFPNTTTPMGLSNCATTLERYLQYSCRGCTPTSNISISHEYGSIGWLIDNATVDSDACRLVGDGTIAKVHSVQDVLDGAAYLERALGIAEEAFPEIAFAREEFNYRHIVHMLLSSVCTAGFKGMPGNLDSSELDLYPLERAIAYAEANPDVSSRGTCRWILRDARILYDVRRSRHSKNWNELNHAIKKAADAHTLIPPRPVQLNEYGEEFLPEPIIPSVWKEILLVRADMLFYTCLSEFAQEMTNRSIKDTKRLGNVSTKKEETALLTELLRVILKTQAASKLYPSTEFDRLLEAEHAALELRTHMTFDSTVSPRKIIMNVVDIKERDKKNGVTSYISLLMPDISQLSDVLDTEQLVDVLEKSIMKDQGYLRCPIGHIDVSEIDLEYIRLAIQSAMPLLNVTGSKEHLSLLSLVTAMLAIRTEVVAKKWNRVVDLIDSHESLLSLHPTLVSEEISRLVVEAENDDACEHMRRALEQGRLTNVLALVKRISRHRSASMTAIMEPSVKIGFNDFSGSSPMGVLQLGKSTPDDGDELFVADIDRAIERAIAIRHKSDVTSAMLRASVLIRALRSAIASGDWDEVQQIVSEESNYTRMPHSSIEEIRAAKAALHYRNCMSNLSKGLVTGAASGVPGKVNISVVDCTALQTAISQAEVLDISDPATAIMLEISHRVCDLRHAVVSSHWFEVRPFESISSNKGSAKKTSPQDCTESKTYIQIDTAVPFSNDSDMSCGIESSMSDQVNRGMESTDASIMHDKGRSVESLLADFKERIFIISDLKAILNMRTTPTAESAGVISESADPFDYIDDDVDTADPNDFEGGASSAPDWVEHQLRAIKSVVQEVKLLDSDLRERKRQELIVSALESIPVPVQQFGRGRIGQQANGELPDDVLSADQNPPERDIFLIKPLEYAIDMATNIEGDIPPETVKLLKSAELILRFRKAMHTFEISNFKQLLDEAATLTSRNMLSLHYGVYELDAYQSATMTVSLAKAELINALKLGRVKGSLERINTAEIEVDSLEFWVSSCSSLMETTKELSMGLLDSLHEAQVMLELRTCVKNDQWSKVGELLDKYSDQFYKFEFGLDEVRHIQFASKYRVISSSISELVADVLPAGKDEQSTFVILKTDALERTLQSAEAISLYLDSLRQAETGSCEYEEDSSLKQKGENAAVNKSKFTELCDGAKCVLELWKAIRNKAWCDDKVAAGQVHHFPRPKDPFLHVFFESIRQHEVAQRLGGVHDQLQVLKINPEKKIRNIRQSIRASIALHGLGNSFTDIMPSPTSTTTPTQKRSRRSSLSVDASPSSPGISPFQKSYSQGYDTSPIVSTDSLKQSPGNSQPFSSPQFSRRRSMGSFLDTSRKSSTEEPAQKILNVDGRIISVTHAPVEHTPGLGVATILCQTDWATLPSFAVKQFSQARNILVDKVTKLRLSWGCSEGAAEEGKYGNISLAHIDIKLLNVCLADVRRINFYTHQMMVDFNFSKDVQAYIKVAKILLSLRKAVIDNNVDGLVQELKNMNYLGCSRMIDTSLTEFPCVEKELDLFERFAFECVAEKTVRNAVNLLSSLEYVNSSITRHQNLLALKNLDKAVKPKGKSTQNYQHCVRVGSFLHQALTASVMCNHIRVKRCEADILSYLHEPESPLGDLVVTVGKVLVILFNSAVVRTETLQGSSPGISDVHDFRGNDITSIVSARRRSVLGQQKNVPLASTFGGFSGTKHDTPPRFAQTVAATMFSDVHSEHDSDISQSTGVESVDEDVIRQLFSLPDSLLDLVDAAERVESSVSVDFGGDFYAVPPAMIDHISVLTHECKELHADLFAGRRYIERYIVDPMWTLIGELVVLSTKLVDNIAMRMTECAVPGSDDGIFALRRLLEERSLMHHSTFEFLKEVRRAADFSQCNIRVHDMSIFISMLCLNIQCSEWRLRKDGRSDAVAEYMYSEKRMGMYNSRYNSVNNGLNSIRSILTAFRELLTKGSNEQSVRRTSKKLSSRTSETESVRMRCLSQCDGLLRQMDQNPLHLNMEALHKQQKNLRAAVSRRKRQFV